ncbi:hypothetical protein FXW07_07230 [Methanosarcina sp. DH1]|uniref:hypothetical protein n=1 Tax=Methanosarcina sp. DH1 TaxID=2605695 RepID=UPI001E4B46FA|nr:hypothetical protein [Methanosarcina sp. DH1]MCC4766412.1 hypothetical protein [Methanosarcina sp. DH1]
MSNDLNNVIPPQNVQDGINYLIEQHSLNAEKVRNHENETLDSVPEGVKKLLRDLATQSQIKYADVVSAFKSILAELSKNGIDTEEYMYQAYEQLLRITTQQPITAQELEFEKSSEESNEEIQENRKIKIKLDVQGLPKFNYINLWLNRLNSPYLYKEAVFQNAIATIASVTLKQTQEITYDIFGSPFPSPLYNNVFLLGLMPPGSSKTTIMRECQKTVANVLGGAHTFTACAPTPETLQKSLCEEQIDIRPDPKTNEMKTTHITHPPSELGIPHCWKSTWDEEYGGFFAKLNKNYMAGSEQMLCSLFSCVFPPKQNTGDKPGVTTEFRCGDVFLTINAFTTPNAMNHLDSADLDSGFLMRFLYTYVDYPIPLPPKSDVSDSDDGDLDIFANINSRENQAVVLGMKEKAMYNATEIIRALFDPRKYNGVKVDIIFHEESLKIAKNWELNMRETYSDNPFMQLVRGRHFENLYKIAALITIGNLPYQIVKSQHSIKNNSLQLGDEIEIAERFEDTKDDLFEMFANFKTSLLHDVAIEKIVVPPDMMKYACKLFDTIYLPSAIRSMELLRGENVDKDMEKLYESIENTSQNIAKAELLEKKVDIARAYETHWFEEFGSEKPEEVEHARRCTLAFMKDLLHTLDLLPDDADIKFITQTQIYNTTRRGEHKMKPLIATLIRYRVIIPMYIRVNGSPRASMCFLHVKTNRTQFKLPEKNYVGYTGTGIYHSGVILKKIKPIERSTVETLIQRDNTPLIPPEKMEFVNSITEDVFATDKSFSQTPEQLDI